MNEKQDFTTGSIPKKMIGFMLPVLGALILQAMYGAVDLMIVGRFGTTEGISGVTTGSSIMNLVTFTVSSLTTPGRETLRETGWTGRRSNVLLFYYFAGSDGCIADFCKADRNTDAGTGIGS